ncbi:hypothetical protein [Pedobacter africanus]|uniref:Uncharacterized protein n=1 Tax=Pedobacter africanus TaxID=151894 RepID=A0A1W2B5V8_9SPHI|nr:hypothetical protein [Pedobacter africanus]SMC68234.1 hypothetical protein SAMN04488524_1942 [Pedobacter africanus]
MKEYQTIIDEYSLEGYDMYSKTISRSEWGNLEIGEEYLRKYWLSNDDYEKKWKAIWKNVFINQSSGLPELVFSEKFNIVAVEGGRLFVEEDFLKLQDCIRTIGDDYFLIIENDFNGALKDPMFRMKFPSDISWKELNSGNFVSSTMLESIHKEFFVFGESGLWGKYSANDYSYPLDIIGFRPEYKELFMDKFKLADDEWSNIQNHLPVIYKETIIRP